MALQRDDFTLLDFWRHGDLAAGEELFERHYDLVYRFFSREVRSDVAPLVQETFTACLEGRRRMSRQASFRAYLLGIAYGMLEAHLKKATRDRGTISGDESTETDQSLRDVARYSPGEILASSAVPDPDSSPNQLAEQQRRRALRSLSLVDRVLIELHDVESLPEQDIATIVGMPSRTVGRRLTFARRLLDRALKHDEPIPIQESSAVTRVPPAAMRDEDVFVIEVRRLAFDLDDFRAWQSRERIQIVLEGDIVQLTGNARQRILDEAREKTGDRRLSIVSIRRGSIIVELEASQEAAAMLEKLFASGDLKSLGGLRIVAVKRTHAELPGPASAGTQGAEAALADFLVSAFTADELRRFVHGFSDGARLDAALPGAPASLSHLASEVVRVLVRHDLVSAELFDRLAAERPHRRDEIHRLHQRFEGAADAG
jgi:RNA polymerase sigma-70 factor (ECF subfamily)